MTKHAKQSSSPAHSYSFSTPIIVPLPRIVKTGNPPPINKKIRDALQKRVSRTHIFKYTRTNAVFPVSQSRSHHVLTRPVAHYTLYLCRSHSPPLLTTSLSFPGNLTYTSRRECALLATSILQRISIHATCWVSSCGLELLAQVCVSWLVCCWDFRCA